MIKRHCKKKNINEKQNTTERQLPKSPPHFNLIGSSDVPASSPPPAAPSNSVNISDGLAPAREADANNGDVALFFGWWDFCVSVLDLFGESRVLFMVEVHG